MTIRHLTVFKAVCEEESITRAAKRLFMTQPAVSHVIADLEDRAGAPLFDRASRRLRLNQMGRGSTTKKAAGCWRPMRSWKKAWRIWSRGRL